MSYKALFLCVVFALAVWAQQQEAPPSCANPITSVPNFDIKNYMGKWYAVSNSHTEGQSASACSCVSVTNTYQSGGGREGFTLEGVCVTSSGPMEFVGDALHLGSGVFDLLAIPKPNATSSQPPSAPAGPPPSGPPPSGPPPSGPPKPIPNFVVLFADAKSAVVTSPCRDNLHILSRSPNISQKDFDQLVAVAKEAGDSTPVTLRSNQGSC